MKKIFIAIILGILMMSCTNNKTEETSYVIDIKPGYRVINAVYTDNGTISVLTEKADSGYVPSEKIITAYISNGTANISGFTRYYTLVEH